MILLGSTGSIGTQALEVAKKFKLPVKMLCAGGNIDLLNQQIKDHQPDFVVIANKDDLHKLNAPNAKVFFGNEGILEAMQQCDAKLVLNALVGLHGLAPSICAMQCKKTLALANKESLVSAGWLFVDYPIIPVDSEHFGIWYLQNNRPIHKITITASGGAFRDTPLQEIPHQSLENALCHPNWKMGNKITIDSATMVNKLFELLEARWLFGITSIDAIIERTSSIHALLHFVDGSITAHFAYPDMALPIAYALDPINATSIPIVQNLSLENLGAIYFETINPLRYPIWVVRQSLLDNPKMGTILNSANDVLVQAFLNQQISFGQITHYLLLALEKFEIQTKMIDDYQSVCILHHEVSSYIHKILRRG